MKKTGILIIGHGSSNASWVQLVDDAVSKLHVSVPVVMSFLEMVEGRLIEDGIRELEAQGVEKIIALPLFVSSGSTHIDEIGYLLGVYEEIEMEPHDDEEFTRIETSAEIHYCPPMNNHPLIVDILVERIRELSTNPAEEVLLLVGHGADEGKYHREWEEVLQKMALTLRQTFGFKGATYGTMHPDNLSCRAKAVTRKNRTIVVPLFLSEGYFTKRVIPGRLEGLDYVYNGKTYLPHPNVTKWLQEVIDHELAQTVS
ncbi:sirohydrochlorin chelatase [Brevibacillus dissolubilis]|uniref:sirohydrochlorin chelatase n=1 Tax=Brevibacillus dissolubilis TaxID=1844116 RepID=UPI001116240E|nr:CbiX/SirB N-terminal domain-containing protein [Brevibacillus dissolubilis]